jgi:hypothetical protein
VCVNDYALGPITVTVAPQTANVNECSTISFAAAALGSPPQYFQWFKNGIAIPGATDPVYRTPPLLRGDNGASFMLLATNLFSSASNSAVVTVTPDLTPPHLLAAVLCGSSKVVVFFDKPLDPASANLAGNYSISGGITVSGAALQSDAKTVILTSSPLVNGICYSLTVSGVTDCPQNPVPTGSTRVIRPAPRVSGPQNLVVVEAKAFDVSNSPQSQTRWVFDDALAGYSGAGYMVALPDAGVNAGNGPSLFPALYLDYCLEFPVAGTYYFWLRGATGDNAGTGNSIHIALDGTNPNATYNNRVGNDINDWGASCGTALGWGWVREAGGNAGAPARVDVPAAGIHSFRIWMREDGVKLDQFVLTTDPAFTLGACSAPLATTPLGPELKITRDNSGTAIVSWDGSGCRLQGTSVLKPNANWQDVAASSPYTVTVGTDKRFFRLFAP